MSKKAKETVYFILIFVVVLVIPNSLFYRYKQADDDRFYSVVEEDHRNCIERANRNSAYTGFCDQIRSATRFTYRSSRYSNNLYLVIFPPILIVLFLMIYHLRKQIVELKEKKDA